MFIHGIISDHTLDTSFTDEVYNTLFSGTEGISERSKDHVIGIGRYTKTFQFTFIDLKFMNYLSQYYQSL